jgi:hypothetical protein
MSKRNYVNLLLAILVIGSLIYLLTIIDRLT